MNFRSSTVRMRFYLIGVLIIAVTGCDDGDGSGSSVFSNAGLYVANSVNNSITVFPKSGDGDIAPIRTISGDNTDLDTPTSIAIDTTNIELLNDLFVVNQDAASITVYNSMNNDNVAPQRTIAGIATGLSLPRHISLDTANNEIAVTNTSPIYDYVTIYEQAANGDTAPTRALIGEAAELDSPTGVYIDAVNDEIFVSNYGANSISVFERNASVEEEPVRTIVGPSTTLSGPTDLFLDTVNDEILVCNSDDDSILVFSRTDSGDVPPVRSLSGALTGIDDPQGVLVDTEDNELFVANYGAASNSITVYDRTASGDVAPMRTIAGASTTLGGPMDMALVR